MRRLRVANCLTPRRAGRQPLAAALAGVVAMLLAAVPWPSSTLAGPRVEVTRVRRVFHNGEHNAFTDLCRFGDRYYLTFRSCPDGHGVAPSARILVLSSGDGEQWSQVHAFQVPLRDTRDPHFLEFRGKLFVITGTWYCGETAPRQRDLNQHLGYAAWTADGTNWEGPRLLEGTYGHYVWRAAAFGEKAYLCGRRKRGFAQSQEPEPDLVESALLESDDGLVWRTRSLFQEELGDETAFAFEPDGALLAVARVAGNRPGQICRSRPPYHEWQRGRLEWAVGGPLLARWHGQWLVGGRNTDGDQPVTALYWLQRSADGDRLEPIAQLPSGGDNSYPGLVAHDDHRAWVSYYSSHERDEHDRPLTAIYLAELNIVPR